MIKEGVAVKKKIHLICNAHIDPVWLWHWEDGVTETLSTFKIAADFCEKYDDFVFNHNEAILYEWVSQYHPGLFRRIQKLSKAGKWHIAGGAFLQPDVNGPSGESHIRQYLLGLSFFKDHFNARPETAYNFDPFGHAEGMPQILSGCGMRSYIFCRPSYGDYPLPLGGFRWRDNSGCEIIARRSDDHYLTSGSNITEKLDKWLEHYRLEEEIMILWGIGNHGGGPSEKEYLAIREYTENHPEYELIHSTPEKFMEHLLAKKDTLPEVTGEIQECCPGCYTSMARLKRLHRKAEGLYYGTENICTYAWWMNNSPYPLKELNTALKDILFSEFHDILPGSSIEQVEEESIRLLERSMEELSRLRFQKVLAIIRKDSPALQGTVPIYLVNPNPFPVAEQTEIEYNISHRGLDHFKADIQLTSNGNPVPYQRTDPENNLASDWRPRLVIKADLAAGEIRRIDASFKIQESAEFPSPASPIKGIAEFAGGGGVYRINGSTGLLDSLAGTDLKASSVKTDALLPKIYPDLDHSWVSGDPEKSGGSGLNLSGSRMVWDGPHRGKPFRIAAEEELKSIAPGPGWNAENTHPVRLLEDGPLRTVIEAIFILERTVIVRRYIIPKNLPYIEIRERVYWNHTDSILRISIPFSNSEGKCISESLYSAAERKPTAHLKEYPNQRWISVQNKESSYLTVTSSDINSHIYTGSSLELNLLRAPAYASFSFQEKNPWHVARFHPRQDQGHHRIVYRIYTGTRFQRKEAVKNGCLMNNPVSFQVYYPDPADSLKGPTHEYRRMADWIKTDSDSVLVRTVKKSEKGDYLVLRLQEASGSKTRCELEVTPFRGRISLTFTPRELKTILIKKPETPDTQPEWEETNLVEGL